MRQEQHLADVTVGESLRGHLRDLQFLRGELVDER
jgi:hypothetical protein